MRGERFRQRRSILFAALPARVQRPLRRLSLSLVPVLQCAIAAGLAWFIAADLLHHDRPFFAPIAAVISLGVVLTKRWRRAMELIAGVVIGIVVGDLIVSLIGSGAWQITVVVALAMTIAVAADGAPMVTNQAAASGVLVATLLPPGGAGMYQRAGDALIGGGTALLIGALVPVNPANRARRDGAQLLATLRDQSVNLAGALAARSEDGVYRVLTAARGTQGAVDAMHADMRVGREVGVMSPLYWAERPRLQRISATGEPIDNAVRNFRVIARRALSLTQRGVAIDPLVLQVVSDLGEGFEILRRMMLAPPGGKPDGAEATRVLRTIVREARAAVASTRETIAEGGGDLSEAAMLMEMRSLLVDMFMVAGLKRESALAQLRLGDR
ncbi:FUSC family protein [Gordonia sp. VNK21]|uniref:FUSC family protein n=1 Tax=Gordonia sp. VNK21 TaxID=3382483 RepID=UPI0038D4A616